ncbi:MAG: TaqI-like C-terminal specificity domain-containing protein [Methanoregula sp.]
MPQISHTPYRNNNLFSKYYLDKYLNTNPEWGKNDHIAIFEQIKDLYLSESALLETLNEKQLEEHFFKPIFSLLGFEFEVTQKTKSGEFPDYAFFQDRISRDDALTRKNTRDAFTNAIAIGEVKQWKVNLDRLGKDEYNRSLNPSLQLRMYLMDTPPKWGILSNGRLWRLYCKDRPRDAYLEVDLPSLITSNDTESFRFFYYFFRKDAFIPTKEGAAFLERVTKGSIEYAREIGDNLKENVYLAMKRIAEGFIERKSNHLDINDPAILERVQKNSMILLYRFLFLLFAEGKGLLDLNDQHYLHYYSFHEITHGVKETLEGPVDQRYDTYKTTLQMELNNRFRVVDQGSEALGITREVCYIPAYNGGLFDPEKHPDLEQWQIGNRNLAEAIDLLSRSKLKKTGRRDFVDYSTLAIRHLGGIYEGLLEFKLRVAEADLVVSDSGWISLEEYNKTRKHKKSFTDFDVDNRVNIGHLYLATDKGERKATGSYYTPDYIVDFIVKNTVGPVVANKWRDAQEKNESFIDATLSINVLDPAMGSGHFLVGAVEFLSQKLLEAVTLEFEAGKIPDPAPYTDGWARREVVSHCIYGVDLNDLAVELAKVGLWLTTISRDKPLSFLDHRLKQGDSLIGVRLSNLRYYPGKEPKDKNQSELPTSISPRFVGHILNKIAEIEGIAEDRIEDIERKEKAFEEFKQLPEYRKAKGLANVYTATYFGNSITSTEKKSSEALYLDLVWAIAGDDKEWQSKTRFPWFNQACDLAKEKSFFHWELEFPEIFFDAGKLRDNPGWDAVIGNPPYGLIKDNQLKKYVKKSFKTSEYQQEKYVVFIELARKLTNLDGYQSLIIPSSYLSMHYFSLIRSFILYNSELLTLILFKCPVFDDPTVESSIYISQSVQSETNLENNYVNCIIIDNIKEFILSQYPVQRILQTIFQNNIDYDFSINIESKESELIEKLKTKNTIPLNDICEMTVGIKPYQTGKGTPAQTDEIVKMRVFDSEFQKDPTYHKYLMGKDIGRYEINPLAERWISYGKWLAEPRESAPFFEPKRIVIRQTADSIIAALEDHQYLTLNNIHNLKLKDVQLQYEYLLAILNSKISTYFHQKVVPETDRTFAEVKIVDLKIQPIRRISFTTPSDRRISLVNEAKGMYQIFAQDNNPQPILTFVDARLAAKPEESDVVHDLIAFLAEQMVTIHKAKNAEIKTFLHFVESEIGAPVESLANKTVIQEYYSNDFVKFVDILVKNKSKIKEGYNPKSPAHYKTLQEWYMDSCGKINPLLSKIEAIDALIDQIVYKLYGLTAEEIAVVEGAGK